MSTDVDDAPRFTLLANNASDAYTPKNAYKTREFYDDLLHPRITKLLR